jgi:hypothetical protein
MACVVCCDENEDVWLKLQCRDFTRVVPHHIHQPCRPSGFYSSVGIHFYQSGRESWWWDHCMVQRCSLMLSTACRREAGTPHGTC